MAFGRDFRNGVLGTDYFRDFKHGERVFVADTMALAPRLKFLYHTYFTLNTAIPELRSIFPRTQQTQIGVLAKSVQLPTFDIQTETLNQYNRSRVVQTGIKYQPVTVVFHDDGSDLIRSLWRQYYLYYYGDSRTTRAEHGRRTVYDQQLNTYNWGLSGEPFRSSTEPGAKPPFFTDITVYGLNQKTNVGYRLVNPLIKTWQHDTFDYSESGGTMEHTVSIEYEYVEYLDSQVSVPGFADPATYDTSLSPLGQAGSTKSVLGPGGVLDSIGDVLTDLAEGDLISAVIGGVRTVRGAREITSGGLREEGKAVAKDVITSVLNGSRTGIFK